MKTGNGGEGGEDKSQPGDAIGNWRCELCQGKYLSRTLSLLHSSYRSSSLPTWLGGSPGVTATAVTSAAALSMSYFPLAHAFGVPFGLSSEFCAVSAIAELEWRRQPFTYLPLLAVVLLTSLTVCVDLSLVRFLKEKVKGTINDGTRHALLLSFWLQMRQSEVCGQAKERDYLRVPLRATTFSTVCLIPLVVFGVGKAMLGQPHVAVYVMMTISTLYTSVRAPATVALTFAGEKKKENSQENQHPLSEQNP